MFGKAHLWWPFSAPALNLPFSNDLSGMLLQKSISPGSNFQPYCFYTILITRWICRPQLAHESVVDFWELGNPERFTFIWFTEWAARFSAHNNFRRIVWGDCSSHSQDGWALPYAWSMRCMWAQLLLRSVVAIKMLRNHSNAVWNELYCCALLVKRGSVRVGGERVV